MGSSCLEFQFLVPAEVFRGCPNPRTCCLQHAISEWTHWDLNPGPSACEADVIHSGERARGYVGILSARSVKLEGGS